MPLLLTVPSSETCTYTFSPAQVNRPRVERVCDMFLGKARPGDTQKSVPIGSKLDEGVPLTTEPTSFDLGRLLLRGHPLQPLGHIVRLQLPLAVCLRGALYLRRRRLGRLRRSAKALGVRLVTPAAAHSVTTSPSPIIKLLQWSVKGQHDTQHLYVQCKSC